MSDETPHDTTTIVEAPATLDREPHNETAGDLDTRLNASSPAGEPDEAERVPERVGRFRVLRAIGSGGMGTVYAAHDAELDRDVAIKLLRRKLAGGSVGRERLIREAQSIAKLSHPNVVHVYEVGRDDGRVFMAMELVRGPTLRQWCEASPRRWTEVVDVLIAAGQGLAAAHAQSIVHRDFKPDNVIVADDGRPRVVDFGLARADEGFVTGPNPADSQTALRETADSYARGGLTATGTIMGTPAYMAPEQFGAREPDARTDQFAFCVTLFEMLYGERPFAGKAFADLRAAISAGTPRAVDHATHRVPRSVHAIAMRGMSRDPKQRYASMHELLEALHAVRTPRRSRIAGWLVAAAAAAGLAVTLARGPTAEIPRAPTSEDEAVDPWAQVVAATDLPSLHPEPLPDDPAEVSLHRLRNGLTLYVAHQPLEPNVAVSIAVRAGSEQERNYGPGLGFFVLMSVFEGSDSVGVADPDAERPLRLEEHALVSALHSVPDEGARQRLLAAITSVEDRAAPLTLKDDLDDAGSAMGGSDLDAFRGSGTILTIELPAHRVRSWLPIAAEAVRRPAFRNVVRVIKEQLGLYVSRTTNGRASQLIQRELTRSTGLVEDYAAAAQYVAAFPLLEAQRFHGEFYRPNNTAVVFVGDITPEAAIAAAEEAFGDWEPAPIPTMPAVDRPLRERVVRHETEDGGPPSVSISWPLPPTRSPQYANFVALTDALNRHDGLTAGLRSKVARASWSVSPQRSLELVAVALPGQSLADVEDTVMRALQAVAHDELGDEIWTMALARAKLTRLGWARSPVALSKVVGTSFIERETWDEIAGSLGSPPTRRELVEAAAALLVRDRIVVHQRPGPTWHIPETSLPEPAARLPYGRHSEFVAALRDAPVKPPEPRFLVEGSHYDVRPYGEGRLITTQRDSPLAHVAWVHPIGVDRDPQVCEALSAKVRDVPFGGMDVRADCTNDAIWVDVQAPHDVFERDARALFAWLQGGLPEADVVVEYVDRLLADRQPLRTTERREKAFCAWALHGERGINAHSATDAQLKRGAAPLLASLRGLSDHAVDVLYAGPFPDAVAELLPAPAGVAVAEAPARQLRTLERDTVFVLDDAARERAIVQAFIPTTDPGPRARLAVDVRAQAGVTRQRNAPAALDPTWLLFAYPWWAQGRLALRAGFECAYSDTALALRTASDNLRRELTEDEFREALTYTEVQFRAYRPRPTQVPEAVRLWGRGETDPRVNKWLSLPGFRYDDMERFDAGWAKAPLVLVIIGDAARVSEAASRFGEVVVVRPAELERLLLDPYVEDD